MSRVSKSRCAPEENQPYFPLYSLTQIEEEVHEIASKDTQRNPAPIRGGVVERTLDEDLEFNEHLEGDPEFVEAEVFAANVLMKATVEVAKGSKIPL
ncbi:hypothetical protein LIER_16632 [Lithospermum erythrorhizon]|uniref:Uncharacterized protein n=1 Tax=Lithospermum erythrorhizon TaxID=34254 RepID=A0AAV3Q7F4_LITER